MKTINKYFKGFSLIELLITMAIIGVLAAIAIPAYKHYSNRAVFAGALQAMSSYENDFVGASGGTATTITLSNVKGLSSLVITFDPSSIGSGTYQIVGSLAATNNTDLNGKAVTLLGTEGGTLSTTSSITWACTSTVGSLDKSGCN